jgi:hypothetical protein
MTDQRELDRLLGAFFVDGTDELADRVIEAALHQIDHTRQRRAMRLRGTLQTMPALTRLAVAAVIGLLAVESVFVLQGNHALIGGPIATPVTTATVAPTAGPSAPAATITPVPSPTAMTGAIGDGRQIHTMTLLTDGRVLVAGGYALGDVPLASASIFDPTTGAFSPTGSMAEARGMHTATRLADGRVLIAGGGPVSWLDTNTGSYLTTAELYDPATGTFSPTGRMTSAREDHTATLLADGRVLLVGGNDLGSHAVASAEIYDPRTGTFSPTGSMAIPRGFHTATLLPDGRVLIAGGDSAAWVDAGPYLATAELYDPRTGTFSPTGSMAEGRAYHDATLLRDGRVLMTGGVTYGGGDARGLTSLASAELYDPKTGRFSPTGSMTDGRVYHAATLLADGRVLVAGGCHDGRVYANNPHFLATAEVYDPATGTFSRTGSMAEGRTWQAAAALADGQVLVTGGYGDVVPLASAERYDPATGTFGPAGVSN